MQNRILARIQIFEDKTRVPDEVILVETKGVSANRRRLGQLKASQPNEFVPAIQVSLLADSVSTCRLRLYKLTLDAEVIPSIQIPLGIKTNFAPAISSTWSFRY
ncbi:hypothetical protein CR513_23204, partial [Mucuna pruriens]